MTLGLSVVGCVLGLMALWGCYRQHRVLRGLMARRGEVKGVSEPDNWRGR